MISPFSHNNLIPNLVFHMRLTPIELSVYSHIKYITQERGICDVTMTFLMERCCLSNTQLKKTIKSLSKSREDLEGKSLIRIGRHKGSYEGSVTDLIYVNTFQNEGDENGFM